MKTETVNVHTMRGPGFHVYRAPGIAHRCNGRDCRLVEELRLAGDLSETRTAIAGAIDGMGRYD